MTDELLSNAVAAQVLNELLPQRTVEQWRLWLRNNRNQSRPASYRIPAEHISGGAFYRREELAKFGEWEKGRQLGTIKLSGRAAEVLKAFGIGEKGSTTQGRRFNGGSANLATDGAGITFVQAIINEPLMVFAMSADQAIDFGTELLDAGQAAKRQSSKKAQQAPDMTGHETLVDTRPVRILGRKEPK